MSLDRLHATAPPAVPRSRKEGTDETHRNGSFLRQHLLAPGIAFHNMTMIVSMIMLTALPMIVHELGHLDAARSCKVSACEVGFGLGPKLFSFNSGSVRLRLRAIPLGSF